MRSLTWICDVRALATYLTIVVVSHTGGLQALAQDQAAPPPAQSSPQAPAPRRSDAELQQLVAPVALYPDNLLGQVLAASTYPLEVVKAARWAKENPNFKGKDLEGAVQQQPWDPSVKGLTSVPQVLQMMSEKLDWTQQLGEAYLAQPDDVSKAVQALRAKAEANGNLKSSRELKVTRVRRRPAEPLYVDEPYFFEIEPVEPDYIYVPIYDPLWVYGPWAYPAYSPFFWYPPGFVYGGGFVFGAALFVGPALWTGYDWYANRVYINANRYSQFNRTTLASTSGSVQWKHDPAHRGGVAYKNTALQKQFSTGKAGTGVQGTSGPSTLKTTTFTGKTDIKGGK